MGIKGYDGAQVHSPTFQHYYHYRLLYYDIQMIDRAQITITSGNGGNGAISGRREKFVPHGGPDGGDGGTGGSIYARCDRNFTTLLGFRYTRVYRAGNGGNGAGRKRHGKNGSDVEFAVPVGTEIWDDTAGQCIADLTAHGQRVLLAHGGRGGRGNARFASSTNQFPLLAEEGDPGEVIRLRLELKLLADVGIVGAPNAGKSSLLAALTDARPKIADYPFTTLEPVLGVVEYGRDGFVMVDIPGLIDGAHAGVGLGDEFLRHIERTRALVHVIDGSAPDPVADYVRVRKEMQLFDESLMEKPEIVAFNKRDVPGVVDMFELCKDDMPTGAFPPHCISAVGRIGLDALLGDVSAALADAVPRRDESADNDIRPPVAVVERPGVVPVLRPRSVDREVKVQRLRSGKYRVMLRSAARFAAMVDVDNWSARVQLYEQLRRQGVISALERAGIRPGDTYIVGKRELEWE